MSFERATQPLDPDAVAAANAATAADTGGKPIRMDQTELRKKWMAAYKAAGGKVETVGHRRKAPIDTEGCCPSKKTVTGKIVSVTFLSDHQAGGGKLIKRAVPQHISIKYKTGVDANTGKETFITKERDSRYGDAFTEFLKPEWDVARGGSADSHPISHTKNQQVRVSIKIDFTVTPDGETASLTGVTGTGSDDYLSFEKSVSQSVGTQRVEITGLVSKDTLPNFVDRLEGSIDWTAEAEGEQITLGTSGTHVIYVTLDKPFGKMACPWDNTFAETGADQVVTETRLKYSVLAAKGTGSVDEQESVDSIFVKLMQLGVGYILDRRWVAGVDTTGITPKPSLHHYLWLCDRSYGQGECHNIAAAMALACRIIGVKGAFDVGYMYPWPSRSEDSAYSKSGLKTSSGKFILGKLNQRYTRDHSQQSGHGTESLVFLDGGGFANNFEGVLAYKKTALYAIGDDVFDSSSSDANENATSYFASRDTGNGIR